MGEGGEGWLVKRMRSYTINGGDAENDPRGKDELIGITVRAEGHDATESFHSIVMSVIVDK